LRNAWLVPRLSRAARKPSALRLNISLKIELSMQFRRKITARVEDHAR
jgi:hypothetical protein